MYPTMGEARIIKDRWMVDHDDMSTPCHACISNYILLQVGHSKLVSVFHWTPNDHPSRAISKIYSELDGRLCLIMVKVPYNVNICSLLH